MSKKSGLNSCQDIKVFINAINFYVLSYFKSADEERMDVGGDSSIHEIHHPHTFYKEQPVSAKDNRLVRDLELNSHVSHSVMMCLAMWHVKCRAGFY